MRISEQDGEWDPTLVDIRKVLVETMDGYQVERWLRTRNRFLSGRIPLDLLAEGSAEKVLEAAESFVNGDPI